VSRRDAIAMSHDEVVAFLEEERTLTIATNGRDGWPHLMPLWYVLRDRSVWAWTYAASQKVRNLERDPRCTLQVEAGTEYAELRGVMFKAEARIHRDVEDVWGVGAELAVRYGGASITPDVEAAMRKQAAKRVGLEFVVSETASWDHRKLGGTY
jgi:PPOX class probable F420-dependent enzyme